MTEKKPEAAPGRKRAPSRRNEQRHTTELLAEMAKKGFVYKIPDSFYDASGSSRFTPTKPFDAICVSPNIPPMAFEFKVHTSHRGFNLNAVKDHQIDALLNFSRIGGGWAFVGVFVTFAMPEKVRGCQDCMGLDSPFAYLHPYVNSAKNVVMLLLVEAETWARGEAAMRDSGRASIPLETLFYLSSYCIGKVKGVWEFEESGFMTSSFLPVPSDFRLIQLLC